MWWVSLKSSLIALCFSCACTLKPSPPLRLYLASSLLPLKESLEKLAPAQGLDLQFLSSSLIAQQVAKGAPCDALVLADEHWQEYLQKKQVIKGPERRLATNTLMLASLTSSGESGDAIKALKSISAEKKVILADPEYVPLGRYSQEALKALGLWDHIRPNALYAHSALNARVMLEQGAAPYALLYKTELQSPRIKQVAEVLPSLHRPISYVFLACKNSKQDHALEGLLFSAEFAAVLAQYGFGPPS